MMTNLRYFIGLCIYIYKVCRSWVSYNRATYPEGIFTDIYTLVYFYPKVMVLVIKSHDKYQSIILVGLAPVKKANSGFWSIFDHYRSYWRE